MSLGDVIEELVQDSHLKSNLDFVLKAEVLHPSPSTTRDILDVQFPLVPVVNS